MRPVDLEVYELCFLKLCLGHAFVHHVTQRKANWGRPFPPPFSTSTTEATPVMAGVPDGPVRAQLVALQLVEGVLPVGVLSRLQLLGCQVRLLIKASGGRSCHLRQRSASEGPQARGQRSH